MDVSPVTVAPFTGETGPAVSISSDPRELFSLLLDDTVVGLIVTETNRYAEQCLAESARVWSTNAEEIRAYIGFNILMGGYLPPAGDTRLLGQRREATLRFDSFQNLPQQI